MERYSYRADETVPEFEDDHPIMVFDGYCGLCSGFIDFILKHDPNGALKFLPAQSEIGESLFAHYGLKSTDYDTVLLIENGQLYTKMKASLKIIIGMGGIWRVAALGLLLPKFLANPLYDVIARNRIKWFGARDTCRLPTANEKTRFL